MYEQNKARFQVQVDQNSMEIGSGRSIGIFHDDEGTTRMLHKNMSNTGMYIVFLHQILDLGRDVVCTLTMG